MPKATAKPNPYDDAFLSHFHFTDDDASEPDLQSPDEDSLDDGLTDHQLTPDDLLEALESSLFSLRSLLDRHKSGDALDDTIYNFLQDNSQGGLFTDALGEEVIVSISQSVVEVFRARLAIHCDDDVVNRVARLAEEYGGNHYPDAGNPGSSFGVIQLYIACLEYFSQVPRFTENILLDRAVDQVGDGDNIRQLIRAMREVAEDMEEEADEASYNAEASSSLGGDEEMDDGSDLVDQIFTHFNCGSEMDAATLEKELRAELIDLRSALDADGHDDIYIQSLQNVLRRNPKGTDIESIGGSMIAVFTSEASFLLIRLLQERTGSITVANWIEGASDGVAGQGPFGNVMVPLRALDMAEQFDGIADDVLMFIFEQAINHAGGFNDYFRKLETLLEGQPEIASVRRAVGEWVGIHEEDDDEEDLLDPETGEFPDLSEQELDRLL